MYVYMKYVYKNVGLSETKYHSAVALSRMFARCDCEKCMSVCEEPARI